MARAAVRLSLFGLLLVVVAALPIKDNWDIYSYHINSTVTSRYAVTVIRSRVANRMEESKEIEFHVRIPKNAFITKFKMVIDGQEYDGIVKEKETAQRQYSGAVSQGQSAGIISSVGRTLEQFKTSVTVAAHKKVTFELTYEELLKRRLGLYELQIHARPMQPVKDFKVDVHVKEDAGITSWLVKGGLNTKDLATAVTSTKTEKQVWLYFYPTVDQQKSCDSCDDNGMNGDLVIVYDVKRDTSLGDIKRSDKFFVHHFAPSNLPRIPKNVVFIIDQSGSMHGRKIEQTRTALVRILNDLAEDDFFGIITFDSRIFQWKRELVQANQANLESARTFARNIKDNGATDINAAVLKGADMLNAHPRQGSASILILLTDGDPTTGETNLERIQSNVRKAIADKFPLYCLGFGFDVDFEFLEKMSLQNNGVARRIYEDSDADLQLKDFYNEVATPLLTDVTMVYIGGSNLTKTNFSQYYQGSEIVVAGEISDNGVETFTPQVLAISNNRRVVFADTNVTVETGDTASDSQMQRIWAHLTVKQLLERELQLSGSEKEDAKNEALKLSLRYGFVTPLTSMVVTKPQGEDADVLDKPKEGPPGFVHVTGAAGGVPGFAGGAHYPAIPAGAGFGGGAHHPATRHYPPPPPPAGVPGFAGGAHYPGHPRFGFGRAGASAPGSPVAAGKFWKSRNKGLRHQAIPGAGRGGGVHHSVFPGFQTLLDPSVSPHSGFGGRKIPLTTRHYPPPPPPDRHGQIGRYNIHHGLASTDMDLYSYHLPAVLPTFHSALPTITPAPAMHRFIWNPTDGSVPLCFDIPVSRLKLLHYPNIELSINGELNSEAHKGFSTIVIHLKGDLHIEVDSRQIMVREGETETRHTGEERFTVGSATVIRRDKEVDIMIGDVRIVILIHLLEGKEFLWPVLRQRPSDSSVTEILALQPVDYEELQQLPKKLKIDNQEIEATRMTVLDYSLTSPQVIDCWFTSVEDALRKPLHQLTVAEL
ncbi:inter-alpha-trypsin inhibitor heavy chain H3-like isoform X2 [Takifugu rubripes]|uniref:inter-alpha-trypsin inhibitor heavy chain H3-like isoform X2 n=1 Tax=Takifugu rubripes TaxID=31033 RepID=UPI001145C185|nr:inter-alpha-trypsin inhibitor heavy chain H3-like isoform X2 [Takifugu rubripes]